MRGVCQHLGMGPYRFREIQFTTQVSTFLRINTSTYTISTLQSTDSHNTYTGCFANWCNHVIFVGQLFQLQSTEQIYWYGMHKVELFFNNQSKTCIHLNNSKVFKKYILKHDMRSIINMSVHYYKDSHETTLGTFSTKDQRPPTWLSAALDYHITRISENFLLKRPSISHNEWCVFKLNLLHSLNELYTVDHNVHSLDCCY